MILRRQERDVLGRVVQTHVEISCPDRNIFYYGKMERLTAEAIRDDEGLQKDYVDKVPMYKGGPEHQVSYFREKKRPHRAYASIDQDLITDSPTIKARNTTRGNNIVKFMAMVVILMAALFDVWIVMSLSNPQVSSQEVYNQFNFITMAVLVFAGLIFAVWYLLGFIDVHKISLESLDEGSFSTVIPVYLSHPDRGQARKHILRLHGLPGETIDAMARSVHLLNVEKQEEKSLRIERLELENDSLKMSLQTQRRRGDDARHYASRGAFAQRGASIFLYTTIILAAALVILVVSVG